MSSSKKGFTESKAFKIAMKYMYGLGAAVVILGALFKIMHWPGANGMLIAGMGTEVLIFAVSAFEPLHEEIDWSKAYPQLKGDFETEEGFGDILEDTDEGDLERALQQGVAKLEDVKLTPDLFESLSGSLSGLKDNVTQLANIENASIATNEYSQSVREATGKMGELRDGYGNTLSAMTSLATSVGGAAENAAEYQTQVLAVTKNLNSLNAIYEGELSNAQNHIKSLNQFYGSLSNAMTNMVDVSKDTEEYRNQVANLTKNLADLNNVYGGMLTAMGRS